MTESDVNQLTEEERQLYDRQIRLWGLESQKRLRCAKVLLIGLNGVGAEIAKNVVLAGIHSLTLMDPRIATKHDTRNQFLIPVDKIGHNRAEASVERAQALNPLVNVSSDTSDIFSKDDDYVKSYDVVIATGLSDCDVIKLNNTCRCLNVKFIACNVNGLFGYSLVDLIQHEYAEETITLKSAPLIDGKRGKPEEIIKTVKRSIEYPPLEDALRFDFSSSEGASLLKKLDPSYFLIRALLKFCEDEKREPSPEKADEDVKALRRICDDLADSVCYPSENITDDLIESVFIQVNPACAIVGGIISQEVIKVISQVDSPVRNILFFNPVKSCANIIAIGC